MEDRHEGIEGGREMAGLRIMLGKMAWTLQGEVVDDGFKRKEDWMGTVLEGFLIGQLELVLGFPWASALLEYLKKKKGKCQGRILGDSDSISLDWGMRIAPRKLPR